MLLYFDQRNVALMRLLSKTQKIISGFGFRGLAPFKLQTHNHGGVICHVSASWKLLFTWTILCYI